MVSGETDYTFTVCNDVIPASRDGSIVFPSGESVSLNAESVLNHMFSVKPVQTLATNYAFRTFRSNGTDFGDTFIYESSRAPNSSRVYPPFVSYELLLTSQLIEYEGFFLGRAETRGTSFEPYTIYAGTNSELLSVNRINYTTTHAQLAGCNDTDSVPYSWNYTFPDAGPVAEHVDSAGGRTSFYVVTITASEPFGDAVYHQKGSGLVQIYEALGAGMLLGTPDLGGEQPPNPNAV